MPVVESLRSSGISVWVDEGNIHAADLWSEQIVQAIADCRVMVVMLSQNSTDSHNVVKEVMLASEQKKALLPVYLEPANIPAKLQYQLAGIQHLELYGQDEQQVLKDLANGLAKRGISLDAEVAPQEISTVKRHDKPNAKPRKIKKYSNFKTVSLISISFSFLVGFFINGLISQYNSDLDEVKLNRKHLSINIPDEYPIAKPSNLPFGVSSRLISISPNGNYFAYVCTKDNERYICIINLKENSRLVLEDSKDGLFPFFSPDEKWIGFVTPNKLYKIEISSGLLKEICNASNANYGAVWGNDKYIYFGDSEGRKFMKVHEDGGMPEIVDNKILSMLEIDFASTINGNKLIFCSPGKNITRGPNSIYTYDIATGEISEIGKGQTPLVYKNYIITIDGGQLRTMKFSNNSNEIDYNSSDLPNPRIRFSELGSQFAMTKNNIHVFLSGSSSLERQLTVVSPLTNEEKPLFQRKEIYGQFSISPDNSKIAVEVVDNQVFNIQILDLKLSRLNTITTSKHNYAPFWGPDSKSIYYTSNRDNLSYFNLYKNDLVKRAEAKIELSGEPFKNLCVSDVSKDGETILCFGVNNNDITSELYSINIKDGKRLQLTNNKLDDWGAVFSENEEWISYTSEKDMQGSYAIYINRFPEMNEEIRISSGGGEEPKWLPDGSGIYYRNGSSWLQATLQLESEIEIGEPKLFFEGDFINPWGPSHDVFSDGRILLLKGDKWIPPKEVNVIINALKEK
jgi:Tol biopolymer transport system component